MEKACGLGLGLLLMVFVQAEHVCCSSKEAQRFQNDDTYSGFQLPDNEPRKFSNPQNKVRRVLVSPNLIKSSSFNARPPVNHGTGKGLSTRSYLEALSQSAQGSARLVKSHLLPRLAGQPPASLRASAQTESKHLGSKRTWPAHRGSPRSNSKSAQSPPRDRYSFTAAEKPTKFKEMGSPAFLFGPVAPRSRGGSAQMQTYARGAATRVYSSRRSPGLRAGSSFLTKNVLPYQGSSKARNWLHTSQGLYNFAVPGSMKMDASQGSVAVYEIPSHYGGFAIRRAKEHDNQNQEEGQTLQQISKPAPQLMVNNFPSLPSVHHPEAKWTRVTLHKL